MLEIAQNFEEMATRFRPIVLIGPGLTAVLSGLFIWLGGLGFRRILVAVVGTICGGICGFFITGRNIILVMVLAIATAVVAIMLEKILVTGSSFWRLTSALCCAALGTLLVFAGMVLLLIYKGAVPISRISQKQSFYAAVFVTMVAFGTIEQLFLCRRTGEKSIRKKETNKG